VQPARAFQICSGEIQQGVIAKTVRVALAGWAISMMRKASRSRVALT